jgi:hypothetical protein
MPEDDQPSRTHRDWTGRRVQSAEARSRSRRLQELWSKIPAIWKALGLVAAIFGAGVGAASYVQNEIRQYVLRHDFEAAAAASEAHVSSVEGEVRSLQLEQAQRDAQLDAIKDDVKSTKDGVRQLLDFMLANPPARRRSP